ncbi:MAG: hypothetical protein PVH61_05380 [Candidatus Aminicenantes bacterium]|jgi:hypothetical protein
MKKLHYGIKIEITSSIKSLSLSDYITEYAYRLLFSSKTGKKTSNGILIHRKTARLILSNGIRIDRDIFRLIISEMGKNGQVKNRNHGIYLQEREY